MFESQFYILKDILVVRLKGELDQLETEGLKRKLNEMIYQKKIKNIIFNMKDLEFMDSSGIGVIIGRYYQIKSQGIIILCEIKGELKRLINLSGLLRICQIKDNEQMALWYLGSH